MYRARKAQRQLFSTLNQYRKLIGEESFYALLAKHGDKLFPDHRFEKMYCHGKEDNNNGRPCIPPSQMFLLFMMQMHDQCSDAEAIERSRFDIRWLAVLDLEVGERLCGRSTLQEFRARVHLSSAAEEQFKAILKMARELGILKGPKLQVALDTTPILGRGAVKDTYNLVADGIRKLVRILAKMENVPAKEWAQANDFSRYWGTSSLKGDAKIDWSGESERRAFLNSLVADAGRLIVAAEKLAVAALEEDVLEIQEAIGLLRRLIAQDTEPVPSSPPSKGGQGKGEPTPTSQGEPEPNATPESAAPNPGTATDEAEHADLEAPLNVTDSTSCEVDPSQPFVSPSAPPEEHLLAQMIAIRKGVAPDRVISVQDPEMRHGRKSASNRFDGYKSAVVVDTVSRLILAINVIPGNAPDNYGALELVQQASSNAGLPVYRALGDCAYGDGSTRQKFNDAGIDLSAKMPSPPADDAFHKGRFILDLTKKIATCPAGQTTSTMDYAWHRHGTAERFCFAAETCRACPHNTDCLRSEDQKRKRGRTITLHPQEHLLQKAREAQATPAFREDIKARQVVEHQQARLVQLGLRQARYFGQSKVKFQALVIAMVANLTMMAKAIFSGSILVFANVRSHYPKPAASPGLLPRLPTSKTGRFRLAS